YGRLLRDGQKRVLNLRTSVIGRRPKFDLSTLAPTPDASLSTAHRGTRSVHFGDRWCETTIYARLDLPIGAEVPGPAILEQPDTTILIEPGLTGRVDRFGNVILERSEGSP
ncbi:MAG: hydantoinase/oxoprolinase family protein, partial [Pseudomonadota bacterium]